MTSLITYNPYRILGVFSNSPKKEVLSNINKSKAFLKVGKEISFPSYFNEFLPSIIRTEDEISKAISEIERPIDQLKHSLFWFINSSKFDDIALKHLEAGDISLAKDIWNKASNMSSLLNLMVCPNREQLKFIFKKS
ncbi:MAG: hypothetical protein J1F07_03010 [Muribaculaceae bacterium]|nr:hypothetical protein [Muribaculaceae bacterium]